MKKHMVFLLGLVVVFCFVGVGNATVLTFDDIVENQNLGVFINNHGYGGFGWENFYSTNGSEDPEYSGYFAIDSGDMNNWVAYNGLGESAKITSDSEFDFTGAHFMPAYRNDLQVTVKGYNYNEEGQLYEIISKSFRISLTSLNEDNVYEQNDPYWLDANFENIIMLEFLSEGGTAVGNLIGSQFVMDNFTINENSAVPEPATLLLLGTGLVALAGISRKRSRNNNRRLN